MVLSDLTEEECQAIIKTAEVVAETLINQFMTLPPMGATSLQLGIIKAISVVWGGSADMDPVIIFNNIMDAMPEILKAEHGQYIN
jgi:hypothetical protein